MTVKNDAKAVAILAFVSLLVTILLCASLAGFAERRQADVIKSIASFYGPEGHLYLVQVKYGNDQRPVHAAGCPKCSPVR